MPPQPPEADAERRQEFYELALEAKQFLEDHNVETLTDMTAGHMAIWCQRHMEAERNNIQPQPLEQAMAVAMDQIANAKDAEAFPATPPQGKDEEGLGKELETVMERACTNLATGMYADLDNKTVNWPRLYSEVLAWHTQQTEAAKLWALQEVILRTPAAEPLEPTIKSMIAELEAAQQRKGDKPQ